MIRNRPQSAPRRSVRRNWTFAAAVCIALLSGPVSRAADVTPPDVSLADAEMIQRGLRWLSAQQTDDGGFNAAPAVGQTVGVTALAGVALLSSGSVPESGPHAAPLQRCTEYLLRRMTAQGFITELDSAGHGPMYGHGFATLFLAEVDGMSEREDLRPALQRATALILASQNPDGGWRYYPVPEDADVSVTACQIMALRAARNAGVRVPKGAIDRAMDYVRRCQNSDGGFRYRLVDPAESRTPRTAAAIVSFFNAGLGDDPAVERGLNYLRTRSLASAPGAPEFYFYSLYYEAQAAWHAGPEVWAPWWRSLTEALRRRQSPEGFWTDPELGDVYATAMALVALQIPYGYTPIFER